MSLHTCIFYIADMDLGCLPPAAGCFGVGLHWDLKKLGLDSVFKFDRS